MRVTLGLLFILYLLTRLYHLDLLPIFLDEANYIYWAKIIATTNQQWFIPLTAQKNLSFIWLIVPFLKILPEQSYLLAGRLPSVLAGALSLAAIYKLGSLVFSRRIGLIAGLLYILCPYTLFHDRMALYDSLLSAFLLTGIYFTIKTARNLDLKNALLWGTFFGLAFLTKATTLIVYLLGPLVYLLAVPAKLWSKHVIKIFSLATISLALSQIFNHSIIVSSGYQTYMTRALEYTPTLGELLQNPFQLLLKNLTAASGWFTIYLSLPLLGLSLFGLFWLLVTKPKLGVSHSLLIFAPILVIAFFGIVTSARYVLFVVPFLILTGAYFLSRLLFFQKALFTIVLCASLFFPFRSAFFLWTNPAAMTWPNDEKIQYISGYASGYGLEKVYRELQRLTNNQAITLIIQTEYYGHPLNAVRLHFWQNPNMKIIRRWPNVVIDEEILTAKTSGQEVYLLADSAFIEKSLETRLETIIHSPKPGNQDSFRLAKIRL